ncbi:hypothetical protein E7T06_09560 [Deinococcus sp. Arct2-2]|uniref:hypothetical protein n=1 Tax=Deinococcus sp. Arct2-2 TaxID=2568653 RepID=UPI0010A43100|nr:hypothetical protein [Deinococcus sp. Arct2-2]THF69992.1 hypothetical protein E7T06_09560 [Deinococcus sp. Arct2-2]
MNFRTLLTLSILCAAFAAAPAHALTLTVDGQTKVTGPAAVGGLAWLPGGLRAVCLGNRLLVLDGVGKVSRLISTGEAPCQSLSVNQAGTLAATSAGGNLNVWRLGDGVRVTQLSSGPLSGSGFVSDTDLLLATPTGLDRLNVLTGARQTVQNTPVTALFVAPDGVRAVVGTAVGGRGRVQLINTTTLAVLSGTVCDTLCVPQNAQFGVNGRTATVRAGAVLLSLREGYPSSIVVRGLSASDPASGFPLPDSSVLTFVDGNVESRDLQTGRRDGLLPIQGVLAQPVSLSGQGRISALTDSGDLLSTDLTFRDVQRVALPAALLGGGEGAVLLPSGEVRVGAKSVSGGFAAVQAMNKTIWTLGVLSEEKQEVGLLANGAVRVLTSVAAAEGAEARLSVNHWGNHALTWNAAGVTVVSQASGKVAASLKASALNLAPAVLAASSLTLSPDAARLFVLPANAAPFVYALATRQRTPLNVPAPLANQSYVSLQISGKGVLALGSVVQSAESSIAEVGLYRPGEAQPYAVVKANAAATRQNLHRFSPDSALLALVNADERGFRVDMVDVASGKIAASTSPLANAPAFLSWSPDNAKLTVGAGLLDGLNAVTVFGVKP